MREEITKDWALYEAGIKYNQSVLGADRNYYEVIDTNIAFASGDQWRNVRADGLPKPVFNIIKRVKQFKIASLKSDNVAITMQPMEYRPKTQEVTMQQQVNVVDLANQEIRNILENINFSEKTRHLLSDGFDTGDWCLHWYFDNKIIPYKKVAPNVKGIIKAEIIDSTNVMFGNPNTREVEKQPYIIIVGRDLVKNLKEEAKDNKSTNWDNIKGDNDTGFQMGDNGKVENSAEGFEKALYIIKYFKENGKVYANKSVKGTYIYENKETGLDYYPIAFNNWEPVKGTYHGRAETTGIIPNQIAINKMFAMVIYHLMQTAFPPAVYDADRIEEWTNEIGAAIPVTNLQSTSIQNLAGYLEPAPMSGQIMSAIQLAMDYTKETLGVGDASLGNVTMNNATAIIAIQKSAAVPLENVKAALYEFTEDCGRIILDMMGTYYGIRPVVVTNGVERQATEMDFSVLKDMWYTVKTDVGESSYYSEVASLQTLDNLLNNGMIEFVDYLKRIPNEIIPNKQELINSIEQNDVYKQAVYNLMGQYIDTLSPEIRAQLIQLNPEQMEQEVLQMMGALDNGAQGMAQMSDMEAMSLGDPGYQKLMTDQTMINRNDAASMQKVEEIG
jgi:hypothetical protein